jgi:hypothetical protein
MCLLSYRGLAYGRMIYVIYVKMMSERLRGTVSPGIQVRTVREHNSTILLVNQLGAAGQAEDWIPSGILNAVRGISKRH